MSPGGLADSVLPADSATGSAPTDTPIGIGIGIPIETNTGPSGVKNPKTSPVVIPTTVITRAYSSSTTDSANKSTDVDVQLDDASDAFARLNYEDSIGNTSLAINSSPEAPHSSGDDAHILQKENDDLRTATSESDNIVMELNMDTTVRYLSACWDDIIG